MDFNQIEIDALKDTVKQSTDTVVELAELQLAMVGGGCGEVTPY